MLSGLQIIAFGVMFATSGLLMDTIEGQPTIPEASFWWSDSCGFKDILSTLDLLRQEVETQRLENLQLRNELTVLVDHNKQARFILAQLIETLHMLVSRLATRYPCQCDVQ